jgi:predicted amidophosphoribosyltransferase
MTEYCSNCGDELPSDWSSDMCEECMNNFASSVILIDELDPNAEDFI